MKSWVASSPRPFDSVRPPRKGKPLQPYEFKFPLRHSNFSLGNMDGVGVLFSPSYCIFYTTAIKYPNVEFGRFPRLFMEAACFWEPEVDARQGISGAMGIQIDVAGVSALETRVLCQGKCAFFGVVFGAFFFGRKSENAKAML